MTDPSYKGLVIIIAGYAHEIDVMLNQNPGLKSRFQRFVDFEDWTSDDCLKFLKEKCGKENYAVGDDFDRTVVKGINRVRKRDTGDMYNHRGTLRICTSIEGH